MGIFEGTLSEMKQMAGVCMCTCVQSGGWMCIHMCVAEWREDVCARVQSGGRMCVHICAEWREDVCAHVCSRWREDMCAHLCRVEMSGNRRE